MDTINTGGPAFPVIAENGLGHVSCGMEMRDFFAAKALQGLITTRHHDYHGDEGAETVAADAYAIADAMIAARGA